MSNEEGTDPRVMEHISELDALREQMNAEPIPERLRELALRSQKALAAPEAARK